MLSFQNETLAIDPLPLTCTKSPRTLVRSSIPYRVVLTVTLGALLLLAWQPQPHRATATYRVVGYYGDWHKSCRPWACGSINEVRFADLSDLIYAFASQSHDSCSLTNGSADARTDFPVIRSMKRRYPHLRVLLSIGGGSAGQSFAGAVSSPVRISRLVHNCVTTIRKTYPGVFDGIDVDWEFPANATQRQDFTRLILSFRHSLGPRAPLTMAVGAGLGAQKWVDWTAVSPRLSWINLMTYDFHGPWGDPVTDFNSPLRGDPHDPEYRQGYWTTNAVSSIVKRHHVAPSHIMLGIPFYGRGYAQVPPKDHGLYQKYRGGTTYGTDAPGVFNYRDIVTRYINRNGFKRFGPNRYSAEPWLYSSKQHAFIGYDDVATMAAKAAYIRSAHLGGAMVWDLAFDTTGTNTSLTAALHRYLSRK